MSKNDCVIEKVKEIFLDIPEREFTCSEIKKIVSDKIGYEGFLPSDYCYNRYNDGISIEKNIEEQRCMFIYIKRNTYKYVGVGRKVTCDIYHKPKREAERLVGKLQDGVVEMYIK